MLQLNPGHRGRIGQKEMVRKVVTANMPEQRANRHRRHLLTGKKQYFQFP